MNGRDTTGPDAPRHHPARAEETATARRGTPFPVDVSVDRHVRTAVALFLAGPVISSVHFMLVYLVVEAGCSGDGQGLDVFDPPVPTAVTVVATAVAGLACLGCALWSYRRWRPKSGAEDTPADALTDREPLAFAAFLLCLLGLTTVLLVGLPALFLSACGP